MDSRYANCPGSLMFQWFFGFLLQQYLTVNPIARVVGLEMGFMLSLPDKTVIRKPDLAVILNSNTIGIDLDDRTYHGTFDMCFEFLSSSASMMIAAFLIPFFNSTALIHVLIFLRPSFARA